MTSKLLNLHNNNKHDEILNLINNMLPKVINLIKII